MSTKTASGRVVLKGSVSGIPELLVTIYDVPEDAQAETIRAAVISGEPSSPLIRTTLGTVVTNESGEFSLRYGGHDQPGSEGCATRGTPHNLFLVIAAPEEHDGDPKSRILFCLTDLRRSAGPVEQFLIRLSSELLEKAGVSAPVANRARPRDPATFTKHLRDSETARNHLHDSVQELNSERLAKGRATAKAYRDVVEPVLRASLSKVPAGASDRDPGIVTRGDVRARNFAVIKSDIETVINVSNDPKVRAPITGRVKLTKAQVDHLRDGRTEAADGQLSGVPASEIEHLIFRAPTLHRTGMVLRENPIARVCRPKSKAEKCLDGEPHEDEHHDHPDNPVPPEPVPPPSNVTIISAEDATKGVPRYVANLLETMSTPEKPVAFGDVGATKRANQSDIQKRVDGLSLRRSPADVASFYDFHSLQIAFKSVWQEAIDQGILDLAADAYRIIVELGGNPSGAIATTRAAAPLEVLLELQVEANHLTVAAVQDPPPLVVAIFNITREQWSVLSLELRSSLITLTDEVIACRLPHLEYWRRLSQADGERVIRYADNLLATSAAATDSSALNRLHNILSQLEQRIVGQPHAFTVFAANGQERSVNFGILTTYRQKWDPVSYQAGELAKTITLAPKESRKFSKKVVLKRSRASKEAQTNERSRKEDFAKTSRAEAEITRNAQAKTNFSLTTTGNVKASYGDIVGGGATHTMTFGGDASQTSNEVKKEFREAVSKAAQEYRDERKLEISTEESIEEESVESGELVNPNDELTVTFLFYELQRRYRVSEHIHRILPVVFVAQEDTGATRNQGRVVDRPRLDSSAVPTGRLVRAGPQLPEYSCRWRRCRVARDIKECRAAEKAGQRTQR